MICIATKNRPIENEVTKNPTLKHESVPGTAVINYNFPIHSPKRHCWKCKQKNWLTLTPACETMPKVAPMGGDVAPLRCLPSDSGMSAALPLLGDEDPPLESEVKIESWDRLRAPDRIPVLPPWLLPECMAPLLENRKKSVLVREKMFLSRL